MATQRTASANGNGLPQTPRSERTSFSQQSSITPLTWTSLLSARPPRIERSLTRLGLPYVDLYYIHRLAQVTPSKQTIEATVQLKEEGEIKYIGLKECSAWSLWRAHAVHPISCIQMEYNPFCLNIEPPKHQLLDTAQELGVAVISYSPLGNRLLSGTFQSKDDFTKPGDIRGSVPWFSDDNFQTNLSILDKIGEIARSKGVTAAQSTLAWILSQEGDFFVMPSTTKAHRVAETLGSLEITVTPEEKAISQAL